MPRTRSRTRKTSLEEESVAAAEDSQETSIDTPPTMISEDGVHQEEEMPIMVSSVVTAVEEVDPESDPKLLKTLKVVEEVESLSAPPLTVEKGDSSMPPPPESAMAMEVDEPYEPQSAVESGKETLESVENNYSGPSQEDAEPSQSGSGDEKPSESAGESPKEVEEDVKPREEQAKVQEMKTETKETEEEYVPEPVKKPDAVVAEESGDSSEGEAGGSVYSSDSEKGKEEEKKGKKEEESKAEEEKKEKLKLEEARKRVLKQFEEEEARQKEALQLEKKKRLESQREAEELEAKLKAEEERLKREATLEKFWTPIRADPDDFPAWTKLLQYVESHEHSMAEKVYNEFLEKYPFCFGYWKKFADFQRIRVSPEAALSVFQRGVKAIPLSVDLWVHYLNFMEAAYGADNPDAVLSLCEDALNAAGLEFRSNKLWDLCIRLAEKKGNVGAMWSFYRRLMKTPTLQWQLAKENCLNFITNNDPAKYMSSEEYTAVSQQAKTVVLAEEAARRREPRVTPAPMVFENGAPVEPGLEPDLPPGCDNLPPEEKMDLLLSEKEKRRALDELINGEIEACFGEVELECQKRFPFESALKRPYFHVKPLEKAQLKNWREYLDFEISEGDPIRIRTLFERCLIACAYYEEFWRKYADYLIQNGTGDPQEEQEAVIRDVYARACTIHLPKKIHIHFEYAAFEEARGHPEAADEILQKLESKRGTQLLIGLRRIQLARRTDKTLKKAEEMFDKYWKEFKGSPDKDEMECLGLKYARFLRHGCKKVRVAVDVLKEVKDRIDVTTDNSVSRVYLALLDCFIQMFPEGEEEALKVFEEAVGNRALSAKERLMFSQRRIEFLEDFGGNIETLQRACAEHAANVKELSAAAAEQETHEQRKRGLSTDDSSSSGQQAKKPRLPPASTPTTTAQQYPYYNQNYYPHAQWGTAGYTAAYGTGYPTAAAGTYGQAGYTTTGYYGTGY
ncbi:unnamed protein product [Cyprideis torosa]|uniref:Pre-mRNA-processing factor 39 n=1 Tax=Cyprideis torosa TaxID=163714 RepID=A0A7R8ZH82_9CRUS|nr:unnamed protein product [Cyprideis torosa]CAG0883059.1 unnamed protein product [Cyprideis torosa]